MIILTRDLNNNNILYSPRAPPSKSVGLLPLTLKEAFDYEPYLKKFNDFLILHDLKPNTIKNYNSFLKRYFNWLNANISQLRIFILYVLNKPWDSYQIPKMKFNTTLSDILSKKDIFAIIVVVTNLKHKAITALIYSTGLRKSEVLHLKYDDINRKNMKIYINPSKSRSDRYALLSKKTLDILTRC